MYQTCQKERSRFQVGDEMKLLFCSACGDVVCLRPEKWRQCKCKKSGGQYNEDNITATVGGNVKIFGIANTFFNARYPGYPGTPLEECWTGEVLFSIREQAGYSESEIWWGGYKGDVQLLRIK